MHRLRSGLSQNEVAFLLDMGTETAISRHESFQRSPSLEAALAYEVIYRKPVRELFAGEFARAEARVREQAEQLLSTFASRPRNNGNHLKRETLSVIVYPNDPVIVPLWDEEG